MKIHTVFLLICLLSSCKAQDSKTTKNDIMIPQIDNKFETFDIEDFYKGHGSRQDEKIDEAYIIRTGDWKNTKIKSGYSKVIYHNNSYFSITKNYYPNGYIEMKGVTFNNGSEYGTWYEFDKQGNLIKEINTDEGYFFDWKKIINYCNENKIPLTKGYVKGGYQTHIYKETLNGEKVWKIEYVEIINDEGFWVGLILDGKTGDLLAKKQAELEGS